MDAGHDPDAVRRSAERPSIALRWASEPTSQRRVEETRNQLTSAHQLEAWALSIDDQVPMPARRYGPTRDAEGC